MTELARGSVNDRPWGRTFAALGLRGQTGQLTVIADGKRYPVAFHQGAVVASVSPLAIDSAVRVALTGGLITSTQVQDIARRQAAKPGRDEIELIAEQARLSPDQAMRLRRRVVAQRAARTFSVERGEFILDDEIQLDVIPGAELDVRAVVYLGSRHNLSDQRLAVELGQIGNWFAIKPDAILDLPQFGFGEDEHAVIEMLLKGAGIQELEQCVPGIEQRMVHAVIYALVSCSVCDYETRGRVTPSRTTTPPPMKGTQLPPPPVARGVPSGNRAPTPPPTGNRAPTPPPTAAAARSPGRAPPSQSAPPFRAPPSQSTPPFRPPHAASDEMLDLAPVVDAATVSQRGSKLADRSSGTAAAKSADAARRTEVWGGTPKNPELQVQEVKALIAARARLVDDRVDHFTMLGVTQNATAHEIRKAYFALARQLHPDRLSALGIPDDNKRAQRLFAHVNTAFGVLSSPALRSDYDKLMKRGGEAAVRAEDAEAEKMAERILEAEEAFRRGEMAMKRDQAAAAITEFQRAIELNPNESDYVALLAWAMFCNAPDKVAAAQSTRRALAFAIRKSPNAAAGHFYLGRVERMLGRDAEALERFQSVVEIQSNHAEAISEIRYLEARLHGQRSKR